MPGVVDEDEILIGYARAGLVVYYFDRKYNLLRIEEYNNLFGIGKERYTETCPACSNP